MSLFSSTYYQKLKSQNQKADQGLLIIMKTPCIATSLLPTSCKKTASPCF